MSNPPSLGSDEIISAMPCTQVKRSDPMSGNIAACASPFDLYEGPEHRDKLAPNIFPINACVARPVPKSESKVTWG
eukprot:1654542-Heterocapsa_arctica.AAC.1